MSATDLKRKTELHFASYAPSVTQHKEIDLLRLLEILLAAKKRIATIVLTFALMGFVVSFLMPQKWTSKAVVTTVEFPQWNPLRQVIATLKVLDVDVAVKREDVFNLFIKKFQSQSLLEEYMKSSPYVMEHLKGVDIDPLEFQRAVANIAERMKAQDNATLNRADKLPYYAWTLSFTAPNAQDAQEVLNGYIDYISARVKEETLQNIRNTLALKIRIEQERLALDRVRLTNIHNINLKRLNYSLEVANAAGIKKPVYSNGQAVKDDPDYSVALGADGIAQKLEIEKSLKDVKQMNADFQNREYHLAQLKKFSIAKVNFEPFTYQLSPSMPVKRDGPGRGLVILLASLVGVITACGSVFLREAMSERKLLPLPVAESMG